MRLLALATTTTLLAACGAAPGTGSSSSAALDTAQAGGPGLAAEYVAGRSFGMRMGLPNSGGDCKIHLSFSGSRFFAVQVCDYTGGVRYFERVQGTVSYSGDRAILSPEGRDKCEGLRTLIRREDISMSTSVAYQSPQRLDVTMTLDYIGTAFRLSPGGYSSSPAPAQEGCYARAADGSYGWTLVDNFQQNPWYVPGF